MRQRNGLRNLPADLGEFDRRRGGVGPEQGGLGKLSVLDRRNRKPLALQNRRGHDLTD
jgi:hypothetical protein